MTNNKKYIIANWKMQLSHQGSIRLARDLADRYDGREDLAVILCPSFTSLTAVKEAIEDSPFKLGAQDVFYRKDGPYTGEISPAVLKEIGCEYGIVGHSERRMYLGETDEQVNRKLKVCLDYGLTPIMCVGETLDERRQNFTDLTIVRQINKGLENIELGPDQKLIIAYEPVWALSPAPPADPKEVEKILQIISRLLLDCFSRNAIEKDITLIYGGAVDSGNVNDYVNDSCQGAIVGHDSLTADSFIKILEAAR